MNNYNNFKIKVVPKNEKEFHGKTIKKEYLGKEIKRENDLYIVIEKYKIIYEDNTTSIDIIKTRYSKEEFERLEVH